MYGKTKTQNMIKKNSVCAYIHAQNKCTYLRYVIAKIKKRKRRFFKAFLNEIKEYYLDINIIV